MGKISKSLGVAIIFLLCFQVINAQSWTDKNGINTKADFDQITQDFDAYWQDREQSKGNGFKPFKRWEYKWKLRQTEAGKFPDAGQNYTAFNAYLKAHPDQKRDENSPWVSLGPNDTGTGYQGRGRVMSIALHPNNANILYVGSAGGGLWKSTNGGTSWIPKTDFIGSIGVSAIVLDSNNPDIIYIGTGDGDASDNYSIGVLKSLDGGDTWNTTGLDWATSSSNLIRRMVMDVDDNNTIVLASNRGIFRSVDAGVTFTEEIDGNFYDVEVHHDASSNAMYAATNNDVYKSTNNGNSWSLLHTIENSGRLNIATTPEDEDYLYILSSGNSNGANGGSGFNGLYRSTNSGTDITLQSDSPNLLNGSSTGSGTGGQGWYDLAFAADPANPNTVHVAGVNHWKSEDGGETWTLKSHWYGGGNVQSVHADKHLLQFQDDNTLWEGNDGGIYVTTDGGTLWTDKTGDMVISQMYRLSMSETDNQGLTGLQDNGTLINKNDATWDHVIGGDGMDCVIHPANGNVMYGEYQFGNISRSTNGGSSWSNISNSIPGDPGGAWITPIIVDPNDQDIVFAAFQDIFKSTNKGSSWTALGTESGSNTKQHLIMSPINNDFLIVGTSSSLWSTKNGGDSWQAITSPSSSISMVAASPANIHTIYSVRSGYNAGQKVYKSTDGGLSWQNISGNLPNIPCNGIAIHDDGKETVYIGMDVGVYFKNEDTPDWTLFNVDLPNVEIRDIDIKEASEEVFIATYGRGLWKNDAIGSNSVCPFPEKLAVSEVVANTVTITWEDPINAPSNGYEWTLNQSQIPSGTLTSTLANSVIIEDLIDDVLYYIHLRSDCGEDQSSWSTYGPFGPFSPDNTCDETNYDTGGSDQNYSDFEEELWIICPEEGTYSSTITFNSFNVEASYDALYIHDGIGISSPLFPGGVDDMSNSFPIGGFNGTTIPGPFTSTNGSGCITLRFKSDNTVTRPGWDIDITCTELCTKVVTNTDDSGAGSLRDVIACATNGNTITFDPSISGQTINLLSQIDIVSNIKLLSLPIENITINVDEKGPVFMVMPNAYLQLENLTLYGGINDDGSAIENNGILYLEHIIATGNANNPIPNSIVLNKGIMHLIGVNNIE